MIKCNKICTSENAKEEDGAEEEGGEDEDQTEGNSREEGPHGYCGEAL